MSFIHDDFLLPNAAARRLYHEVAAPQPILDYHCHLPPEEVATDRRFPDLAEIWLGGDHYKWRAMRAAGIPEELVTGRDADPREKFRAWARTVPQTVRNPLYHWTHLELKRYFDCDLLLSPSTADEIWELTSTRLAEPRFSTQSILRDFDVRVVGTTDDPADSLEHHEGFAESGHPTGMYPTFRPDRAVLVHDPVRWREWADRLGEAAGRDPGTLEDFMTALEDRHRFFHEHGCRLSDHGLESCPFAPCSAAEARTIYETLRRGGELDPLKAEQWQTWILQHVGRWNASRGWTMQLHLGALRSANTRMLRRLRPDTGYDSQSDEPLTRRLAAFLDSLEQSGELPKTVLYHVNPAFLAPLATLMGSFQDGVTPGKMQLGSGWWHLDTLDGMTAQIEILSSVGLLGRFVGMLTDSRSFLSFPRHEYFRRLLCKIIGEDVEAGLIPNDAGLLDGLVRGICYENAREYFGFPAVTSLSPQ